MRRRRRRGKNPTGAIKEVWRRLRASFPDMERRDSIFLSGASGSKQYVAAVGIYQSNFVADWLGLAATGKRVTMRVMDFYRIENGLIAENWIPLDTIDALLQLGTDVLARVAHLRGKPKRRL